MLKRKTTPIPVALDDALLGEVDRTAAELKQSRSTVIRSAMRIGLPMIRAQGSCDLLDMGGQLLVRKGGSVDVVQLDGDLSEMVRQVAQSFDLPRQKVLIESVRAGLGDAKARFCAELAARSQNGGDYDTPELVTAILLASDSGSGLAQDLVVSRSRERSLQELVAKIESDPEGAKLVSRIRGELTMARVKKNLAKSAGGTPEDAVPERSNRTR